MLFRVLRLIVSDEGEKHYESYQHFDAFTRRHMVIMIGYMMLIVSSFSLQGLLETIFMFSNRLYTLIFLHRSEAPDYL